MPRRGRGYLRLLLLVFVAVLAVWLFRAQLLSGLGYSLVEDDGPQKADAAVVLGGDDSGARIVKAAQLAQAGYVPWVLVSGPRNLLGHESDDTIEYARRQGYPVSLFKPFPNNCTSTKVEVVAIGNQLRAQGIHKILLVTSNFHTRRAARTMRKEVPDLQVAVVAAPDQFFSPDKWWKTRDGQKQFFYEFLKSISAWLGN